MHHKTKGEKAMNHHKLKCVDRLMSVAKKMPAIVHSMPRGEAYLVDQFKRALTSAILNLCEGNGRTSPRERNRFFDISLASISETIACIDIFEAYELVRPTTSEDISSDLKIAYVMIRNLKL